MNHVGPTANTTAAKDREDGDGPEEVLCRLREHVYQRQREIERLRSHGQRRLRPRDVVLFSGVQLLLLAAAALATPPLSGLTELAAFQSWQETVFGALLLGALSLPVTLFVANALVACLWDAPVIRRAGLFGTPALGCLLTVVLQWWYLGDGMLAAFVCTTALTAFLPGMTLRYLSRWRLRSLGAVEATRHSRPSTIDLALLTALVAFTLVLYRAWFFIQGSWPPTGEQWQVVVMFGLVPILAVSMAVYCSLRATAGRRSYLWAAWGLGGGLIAGAVVPLLSKQTEFIDFRLAWPLPGGLTDVILQAIPTGLLVTFSAQVVVWTYYWAMLEPAEHLTLVAGRTPPEAVGGDRPGTQRGNASEHRAWPSDE